jgi:hypothetical protein
MILAFFLVAVAAIALVFLVRLAKGQSFTGRTLDAVSRIQPVDLEAFRNLMDPAEEDYLRESLSRAEFRMIHRERLRAALEYIFCAAQNAAFLVRAGDAARRSPEPSVAEAGERLMNSAISLRLLALQAMAKLYWGIVFPSARSSSIGVADSYERVTGLVFLLGRLQHPSRSAPAVP